MPLTGDLACFVKLVHRNLTGLIGTYGHDYVNTKTKRSEDESRITKQIFESNKTECESFLFDRIQEPQIEGKYLIIQESDAQEIAMLNMDCTFDIFRARRHRIAWPTHTTPDLCAVVSILSQVITNIFKRKHVKLANNTICKAATHNKRGLS